MGHSHSHGGHHHHNDDDITSEANVDLYIQVGHLGLLGMIIATYFMWISQSHTTLGEVLHGFADVVTIYAMGGLAHMHKIGKATEHETNRRAGVINTALLFFAAVGVVVDLLGGREHSPDLFNMTVTASVALTSNLLQFIFLWKAHGHEHKHASQVTAFGTTLQHVFFDILFDLVVLATVFTAKHSDLAIGKLDVYAASLLIALLLVSVVRNLIKLKRGQELDLI